MYQRLTESRVPIRAVFVDVDNTLLDFDAYVRNTMKEGFERFGLPPYEPWMYRTFLTINNRLWHQIELAEISFEELQKIRWNCIFEELGIRFDGPTFETYFRSCLFTSAVPVEGSLSMLRQISESVPVCAASNGPYEQQVNRLRVAGMLPYMTDVFVSERIGAAKPAPEFFERSVAQLNETLRHRDPKTESIRPEEILMIGDSLTSDMDGGIAAGMQTCLFTGGNENIDRKGRHVDLVVSDLMDIPRSILM